MTEAGKAASLPGAFFDLDRTVIPGSSLSLLARGLRRGDLYGVRDLIRMAARQTRFAVLGETDGSVRDTRQDVLAFITGRDQSDLQAWGRQIATNEVLPRVYPDIVRIIAGHRTAGHRTLLVTSSPVELAEPIAAALDMDGALGTTAEVDSAGRYTGRLSSGLLHGPAKAAAVAERAAQDGIDLAVSHAYSDSVNDRLLLESVGYPHAVNPEPRLLDVALRNGWAIHELRPVRRQLLVGVPPVVSIGGLFLAGFAAGYAARGSRP